MIFFFILNDIKMSCLGGASKFVEPEARKHFPNHEIVTEETLGAAIGAAKFLQIQR